MPWQERGLAAIIPALVQHPAVNNRLPFVEIAALFSLKINQRYGAQEEHSAFPPLSKFITMMKTSDPRAAAIAV